MVDYMSVLSSMEPAERPRFVASCSFLDAGQLQRIYDGFPGISELYFLRHQNTSEELILKIVESNDFIHAVDYVLERDNLSSDFLDRLGDAVFCRTPDLDKVCYHPNVSSKFLLKVCEEVKEDSILLQIAAHSSLPAECFFSLSARNTPTANFVIRLLSNPSAPADFLEMFAGSEFSQIRFNVAVHSNTSPKTLAKLVTDDSKDVALAAVLNPNCPGWAEDLFKVAF